MRTKRCGLLVLALVCVFPLGWAGLEAGNPVARAADPLQSAPSSPDTLSLEVVDLKGRAYRVERAVMYYFFDSPAGVAFEQEPRGVWLGAGAGNVLYPWTDVAEIAVVKKGSSKQAIVGHARGFEKRRQMKRPSIDVSLVDSSKVTTELEFGMVGGEYTPAVKKILQISEIRTIRVLKRPVAVSPVAQEPVRARYRLLDRAGVEHLLSDFTVDYIERDTILSSSSTITNTFSGAGVTSTLVKRGKVEIESSAVRTISEGKESALPLRSIRRLRISDARSQDSKDWPNIPIKADVQHQDGTESATMLAPWGGKGLLAVRSDGWAFEIFLDQVQEITPVVP